MIEEQDKLRERVKELKWKNGVSYKELSIILGMKYNSFINFVHGYKRLGYGRAMKLERIVEERSSNGRVCE